MSSVGILASALIGLLVFIYGFLPMRGLGKSFKEGEHLPDVINGIRVNSSLLYKPVINRLVLMVIDALRDDFVTGSAASNNMPYLSSVIHHGEGLLFTSLVEPPTVTLPRIKAITMGIIPNYADVILNILEKDASGSKEDSLIGRATSSHLNVIFYGDDTWLRIFPESFMRQEGTSSFYVSDFTEVDNNVTRHLDCEFERNDWDVMILHYLGLDHIGHIHGPYSPLVPLKLQEMDDIIKKIHQSLKKWGPSTLLVVCGDHGMKDTGGHGGATHPEIHIPIAFLSPMISHSQGCSRKTNDEDLIVNQRDLAPTLSALLGLPPPSGNLGCALSSVLQCFIQDPAALVYAMHVNVWQIAGLLNSPMDSKNDGYFLFEEANKLSSELIISQMKEEERDIEFNERSSLLLERIIHLYSTSVFKMTSKFAESLIKFDYYAMFLGGIITWKAFLSLLADRGISSTKSYIIKAIRLSFVMVAVHVIVCATDFCGSSSSFLCKQDMHTFLFVTVLAVFISYNSYKILYGFYSFSAYNLKENLKTLTQSPVHCLFLVGGLLHALSFASSSFVEEEHQTWQFLCISLIFLQGLLTCRILSINVKVNHKKIDFLTYSPSSDRKCEVNVIDRRHEDMYEKLPTNLYIKFPMYSQCCYHCTGNETEDQYREMHELGVSSFEQTPSLTYDQHEQVKKLPANNSKHYKSIIKMKWLPFFWALIAVLFILRILRNWNHTGDKWGNLPGIADWISRPEKIIDRSFTMAISLSGVLFILPIFSLSNYFSLSTILTAFSLICIYAYRTAIGDVLMICPYPSSRGNFEFTVFLFLLIALFMNGCFKAYKLVMCYNPRNISNTNKGYVHIKQSEKIKMAAFALVTEHLSTVWILYSTSLKRPCDVPIVVAFLLSCRLLTYAVRRKDSADPNIVRVLTMTYIWLGMVFYFYQGNSNSLASIDLQAGYVGQENYNPLIVGVLLFSHTFSMPIVSILLLLHVLVKTAVKNLYCNTRCIKEAINTAGRVIAYSRLLPIIVYIPLITIQRHHLFIWTVFSPKLLYEASLTLATFIGLTLLGIFELCL